MYKNAKETNCAPKQRVSLKDIVAFLNAISPEIVKSFDAKHQNQSDDQINVFEDSLSFEDGFGSRSFLI